LLQIYMARDGLARFCTVPYQHPNNRNIHSAYMHLTNYSLNKRSRNYLHTESEVLRLLTTYLPSYCHIGIGAATTETLEGTSDIGVTLGGTRGTHTPPHF